VITFLSLSLCCVCMYIVLLSYWTPEQIFIQFVCILWRSRHMRELLKFRNLKERDCATVAERYRVLPPLPSPRFAPLRVLLGCAVTLDGATVRKDHVTSVMSVHGAAFSACRIPAFVGETEGSAAPVKCSTSSDNWEVGQCSTNAVN
jgi:hypothetical protein